MGTELMKTFVDYGGSDLSGGVIKTVFEKIQVIEYLRIAVFQFQ